MEQRFIATATITINAAVAKVWEAITTPDTIAKYLYGTKVTSGWEEGSEIKYTGEYNGKTYEDKGVIKALIPNEVFASTYWSSMGGKEDRSENYNLVTYALKETGGYTRVTLTQDNIATEEERQHSQTNWEGVLKELKKVVEAEL